MILGTVGQWNKSHNSFSDITTIHIGGEIKRFIETANYKTLINIVNKSKKHLIIGEGSNIVASDKKFQGTVIRYTNSSVKLEDDKIIVSSGASLDLFIKWCIENNLHGFEYLSGIPGTIGGAIVQNAGAYGSQISDLLLNVRCYDVQKKEFVTLGKNILECNYRSTILKNNNKYIVISATFKYKKFFNINTENTVHEIKKGDDAITARKKILNIRKEKGAIFDFTDSKTYSCGSFFKNPILKINEIKNKLSNEKWDKLKQNGYINGDNIKVSAGYLIESSGIKKGFNFNNRSNVQISNLNNLIIVNNNNGNFNELQKLQKYIQKEVNKKFKIELTPEVVFVN